MLEDAARARAAESKTLEDNNQLCGALYLAGYVVECRLKTLLNKRGKPFPTSGSAGHDLTALWRAADFAVPSGFRKAFLEFWTTSIRYSAVIDSPHRPEDLLRGGKELSGFINRRITHTRGVRRRPS